MIPTPPPVSIIRLAPAWDGHYFDSIEVTGQVNWLQSTITVPTSLAWSAQGEIASAWTMADNFTLNVYTQVGWLWDEGAVSGAPILFTETNTPAGLVDHVYRTLTPGDKITVATSCDFGTDTYHNWIKTGWRWKLLSSSHLGIGCGSAHGTIASEIYEQATPVANPLVETGSFAVVNGAAVALP